MFVIQHQPHGWRTSGENLFVVLLMMAPPSQELEPPANPGRFTTHCRPEPSVHRHGVADH